MLFGLAYLILSTVIINCDSLEEIMKTTYDLFVSFLHFMILGKDRKELVVGERRGR